VVLLSGARGAGKTRLAARGRAGGPRGGGDGPPRDLRRRRGAALRALDAATASRHRACWSSTTSTPPERSCADALARAANDAAGRALVVATTRDPSAEALGRLAGVHHRALGPLDTEAIRAIAGLYAGPRGAPGDEEADALTIERLAEASGGVPLRVHELAAEWARAATARRLGRGVAAAQARRSALQDAETALAEDALEFQLARERALLYFPELARARAGGTSRPPFKGLEAFSSDDADDFFGRERLVGQLVARLAGATFLGLVGPSGSGKSSALRAGLLPALAGGVLPGSERWEQHVIRPGTDPQEAIDRLPALDGLGEGARLLVVVDQFEEVFTASAGARAHAFAQRPVALARDARQRAVVVVAVRADFYGRCAELPDLAALLGPAHVLVGPVGPEELQRAIELPAERAGLAVEPGLTEAFIRDVADAPGTLPLVSTALLELWETRRGRVLRLEDYERMGGVHGAVARLAESAWSALTPDQQPVARGILLRLAGDGEGDGAVRRRVPLTDFDVDGDPRVAGALATLTARRVVTADGDGIELAHEALLREWPRLRAWLEDDVAGRAVGRRLAKAAIDWDRGGRDAGELYRGARLAGALDWSARHPDELNELEREFLERSRAAAEAETRRFRRTNRRLRALVLGVGVLLAAAVAVGTIAFVQGERARDAERRELGERLGAQALAAEDLARAVLLGRQALEFDDSVTTRGALLGALLKGPAALRVMRGDGDRLLRLASSRANVLAVADNDGTVVLFDARSFRPLGRPLQFRGQVSALDVSPDGRRVAVSYADGQGALEVVDLRSRRATVRRRVGPRYASSLWFSRDGGTLLAAFTAFGREPNRVELVDARTGRTRRIRELPVGLLGAGWAGRDRILAAWRNPRARDDGAAAVLDARTLGVRRRFPRGHDLFVVDRAGRRALFFGEPGLSDPEVLRLGSGRARTLPLANPAISGAAFSPDGDRVLTVGERGRITVQDAATFAPVEVLEGHAGTAFGPVFAPDGETFFTAGLDSSIIAWDLPGRRRLGRPFDYAADRADDPGQVRLDPAFSPDGRSVAVPTPSGRLGAPGRAEPAPPPPAPRARRRGDARRVHPGRHGDPRRHERRRPPDPGRAHRP
jgi:WD40 repeat protein